jgi:hypothetical protein
MPSGPSDVIHAICERIVIEGAAPPTAALRAA